MIAQIVWKCLRSELWVFWCVCEMHTAECHTGCGLRCGCLHTLQCNSMETQWELNGIQWNSVETHCNSMQLTRNSMERALFASDSLLLNRTIWFTVIHTCMMYIKIVVTWWSAKFQKKTRSVFMRHMPQLQLKNSENLRRFSRPLDKCLRSDLMGAAGRAHETHDYTTHQLKIKVTRFARLFNDIQSTTRLIEKILNF